MKPEVQALLKKARESVDAAKHLGDKGYWDFAAARAYYAMFYAAAVLLENGLTFSSHSGVIGAFGRNFAKTGVFEAKFHRYLLDGQDIRNAGDYDVGTPVAESQAKDVMTWANEWIAAAEKFLNKS